MVLTVVTLVLLNMKSSYNYYTCVTAEATTIVGSLSLLEDADNLTSKTSQTPPKLSPVSRILHAMSSWCTPSTWQLLARLQSAAGGGGGGGGRGEENTAREEEDEAGGEHVDRKEEQEGDCEVVVGKNQSRASASGGEGEKVERVEEVRVEEVRVEEVRVEEVRVEVEVEVEGGRVEVEGGRVEVGGGEGPGECLFLPPVHSSAQSQLQMSIFLQQLKRK